MDRCPAVGDDEGQGRIELDTFSYDKSGGDMPALLAPP
jgi:hypothetical protein